MKRQGTILIAGAAAVLAVAQCAGPLRAQMAAGKPAQPAAASHALPRSFPAPTNLQALPKTMTGQQVHDLMEQWSRELGTQCDACHTVDRTRMGPDGRQALNFADDSKDLKRVARMMVTMVDLINTNYVAKAHGSGVPVSCGMCHRGELGAEPYEPTKKVDLPESVIRAVDHAEQELQKPTQ